MSKIELIKENILAEYDKNMPLHNSFLNQMQSLIKNLIDREDVKISSMSSRVKEKESLSKKIDKKQIVISEDPEEFKYNNLKDLTDICGIRICTFYSDDVDKIASIIENEFTVDIKNSIDKRLSIEHDRFGYLSLHYIVSLPENRVSLTENSIFKDIKFEIQIRSMLQHTWAEIEHDLGYKSSEGLPKDIKRDFSRLAGLLELADKEFLSIRTYLDNYQYEINKNIQTAYKDTDILIDRITLNEFIKSEFFIDQLKFIADETGKTPLYFLNDLKIDSLTVAFEFLNILTIHDLKNLLKKSNFLLIDSINNENTTLKKVSLVDTGILYYSLYYKMLKNSMPKETLQSLFNILNVGVDYEEEYLELLSIYNSRLNR